jgi:phosphonopyruvate decarboxylase
VIAGREFAAALERHGFDFFTGVPCSLIEDLIAVLERGERAPYVTAAREDAAVGVAAGAWFGGKAPVVLMQNSGLGTSLNALASLSLMYGLPALLVITWRGYEGKDAPEHILTGEITPKLLELLRIPFRVLAADSLEADLEWAAREMRARSQPVAIVVPPRVVQAGAPPAGTPQAARDPEQEGVPSGPRGPGQRLAPTAMSRMTALTIALKAIGEAPVLHANGYICRESFSVADRPQSFYMIGSMGMAPAIALGLALAQPKRRTVVFDGDGNLLMNLGILPMIGAQRPSGLLHLVFDNEVYGSTGNQASPSRTVRLDRLAGAAGFASAAAVSDPVALEGALRAALAAPGPHFVLVKVTAEEAEVPRIPYTPAALRDRFRAAVQEAR